MANLIGTGLNQVPTNGLLGNMAFQNKEAVSMDLLGVSGNLIVNGNVGIGTSSPAYKLDVAGTGYFSDNVTINRTNTAGSLIGMTITNAGTGVSYAGVTINCGAVTSQFFNDAAGNAVVAGAVLRTTTAHPLVFGTNVAERMRITATGDVGIGTSAPDAKLTVSGGLDAVYNSNVLITSAVATAKLAFNPNGVNSAAVGSASGGLRFYASSANTERMRLDSGGNLGLAVTPSAWGTEHAAIQIGLSGAIQSYKSGTLAEYMSIISNAYNDNSNWRYIRDGAATRYEQHESAHKWFTSASGTTGSVVTFTQSMTLDANGSLGIGNTSPRGLLHIGVTANTTEIPVPTGNFAIVRGGGYAVAGTGGIQLSGGFGDAGRVGAWQVKAVGSGNGGTYVNDLLFTTQNSYGGSETERMRITSAGDVGIGTTSPAAKLDVYGGASGATTNVAVGNAATAFVVGVDSSNNCQVRTAQNVSINFYTNAAERMRITGAGNLQLGTASLATNATNGFPYIPTCAGTPTGTPTAITGYAPMVVDSTNNKLYVYVGGAWQAMN